MTHNNDVMAKGVESYEQLVWGLLEKFVDVDSLMSYMLTMSESAGMEILFYLKVAFIIALGIALLAVAIWTLVGT